MASDIDPLIPIEDRLRELQRILIAWATGGAGDWEAAALARANYDALRRDLLGNSEMSPLMPAFLKECRDQDRFWSYIKGRFPSYQERREFLWSAFEPAFQKLEGRLGTPADSEVLHALSQLSSDSVRQVWESAMLRRSTDPDGAITLARTLLETVCKHVLENLQVPFDDGADLPKLYGLTAQALTLAPDQHTEQIFRQILGGCKSVVEGLGAVRNKLSDAHGRSPSRVRPSARHAELAVNLAGAMGTFLVQTWIDRRAAI